MNKVYNIKISGYSATGLIDINGETYDVNVDFTVEGDVNEDFYIDFDYVDVYDGNNLRQDLTESIDLDDLGEEIANRGDLNEWSADQMGTAIDNAMDMMEDR